jgi:hypothetical protein
VTTYWGGDRSMPPPRPAPDDGVVLMRLNRFRSAHPGWRIGYNHELRFWQAWRAAPDGGTVVTRYVLEDLLDKLSSEDGAADPPDSG